MKKVMAVVTIILLAAVLGAGIFAVAEYRVNQRFGFYAKAAEGLIADGLKNDYLAEITFNNLNLTDGSVIRALQVYIDTAALTKDVSSTEKELRLWDVESSLSFLAEQYKERGFTAKYEDGFLDITLEKFDSFTDLYIASGRDGYEESDGIRGLEWGFWYNKYTFSDKTIFSQMENTIIQQITNQVADIRGIDEEDIAYIFNYGTLYSKRTLDSDADNIYYYSKYAINIHKFVMDKDSLDREFTIYQYSPNVITWYCLAIIITAIPAAAYIVYAYKKKNQTVKD